MQVTLDKLEKNMKKYGNTAHTEAVPSTVLGKAGILNHNNIHETF